MATTAIDESRLEAFMGQAVVDLAAAFSAPLVRLGARLGLYRALADGGPATPDELAERTGTEPRMVREWLGNQAAGGYVTYDAASGTYTLPPEQAVALADEESEFYLLGAYDILASFFADEDRLVEAFRSGAGLPWSEHDHRLFAGTEVFFRAGYRQHLVASWLPALDGVVEKLEAGARVADVGCGHGASTIIMAEAFPASTFAGFDSHPGGIERAREAAAEAGVAERVRFEVAGADAFPGGRLRPRLPLRRLPRPRRSGRGGAPHSRGAGARWDADARGAAGRRPARGQPQPGRPDLLRGLGPDLRPARDRRLGRTHARARRAGR